MKRIGLFPGTFDPPSLGHLDIIERSHLICDELIVAAAEKPSKTPLFTDDEKVEMLRLMTRTYPNVKVISFHGLVADLAKERHASFFIRGLRAFTDFEYEFQMALANRKLCGIDTIFLMADEKNAHVSSTLIREIAKFGGPLKDFVPPEIEPIIRKKIKS